MSVQREKPFSVEPLPVQRPTREHFLVVGGGAAGLSAAAAIRARNQACRITLLDEEGALSYSRPMLSKAPLRGFHPAVFTVFERSWYEEHRIELRLGIGAVSLNHGARRASLSDGTTLDYDKCILATGAAPFFPPIKGSGQTRVTGVRNFVDIARVRAALPTTQNAVLIGGGVIALEMAWELQKAGCSLTVLEVAPTLMGRLLDEGSARLLEQRLISAGVQVRTGVQVEAITGAGAADGVQLGDGSFFPAELVVVSCGVAANKALAADAGAEVARAIVVNERMETSLPGLYACGDCAELNGMNLGVWPEAAEQGRVAGAFAAGDETDYDPGAVGVLLSGFGTCLYALGDPGKKPDTEYEVVLLENEAAPASAFLVNGTQKTAGSYEKYYFAENRLTGGVLMDSLLPMETLKRGIAQGLTQSEFMRLRREALG